MPRFVWKSVGGFGNGETVRCDASRCVSFLGIGFGPAVVEVCIIHAEPKIWSVPCCFPLVLSLRGMYGVTLSIEYHFAVGGGGGKIMRMEDGSLAQR